MEETTEGGVLIKDVHVNEGTFDSKLRELAALTNEVERVSQNLSELKSIQESLSYSLAQYMMATGCTGKILDGIKYTQKQRVYSKVEDKDVLRNWIIENDAVDLLMTVHPSKLTAYCNAQLEAQEDTPPGVNPNFIKYYVHVK